MDRTFEQIKTIDYFFNYGKSPLDEEIRHDVVLGLLQPKRSLFYDRADGAGIEDNEQHPSGIILQIEAKSSIVSWIGRRNTEVSNGTKGFPDRRIAASQETVDVVSDHKSGELDITVLYIPLADYKQPQSIKASSGIGAIK
jgi:hypothetical protein